jgi:hydrogenase maturation protease
MKPPLLLALGNDLIGDDAVGLLAARRVKNRLGDAVDVVETTAGGFGLLDHLEGYSHAIIVDAISSGTCPPGTIIEILPEDLGPATASSPHTVGLAETIKLAGQLGIVFPATISIIAMEIHPETTIGAPLSPEIQQRLPDLVGRILDQLMCLPRPE